MRRVKCKSGISGWQDKLQKVYDSFREFVFYDTRYSISERLGYISARDAWKANPLIQGSVIPSDLMVVNASKRNAR